MRQRKKDHYFNIFDRYKKDPKGQSRVINNVPGTSKKTNEFHSVLSFSNPEVLLSDSLDVPMSLIIFLYQ